MTAGDHGKPTAQWLWLIAACAAGMLLPTVSGERPAVAAEQGVAPSSRSVVVPGFWDPRRRPERPDLSRIQTIRFLTERGVPVVGHVGLTPQAVNTIGGFRVQGRSDEAAAAVLADAVAVAEAGAFAMVGEAVVEPLGREITLKVPIPTIGIGASAGCDGQILVLEDMLGLSDFVPKFVKRYGGLAGAIETSVKAYADEVRSRTFPGPDNVYKPKA